MDGGVTPRRPWRSSRADRDLRRRARRHSTRHALRTYESDGLLQYARHPAASRCSPAAADEVPRVVAGCATARACRGSPAARAAGCRAARCPIEEGVLIVAHADAPDPRGRPRQPARRRASRASRTSRSPQAVGPTHFYPPDPSSQIVCSIGGNVAENSGGAHCFKYGFTTNYVTGLRSCCPTARSCSSAARSSTVPGYDLLGAFVGSEGTLGIATRDHAARDPVARGGAHAGRVLRQPPRRPAGRVGHRLRRASSRARSR